MTASLGRVAWAVVLATAAASAGLAQGRPEGVRTAGDSAAAARPRSPAATTPPAWTAADGRLLGRIIAEGRVDHVERGPSWREYGVDLGRAFGRWLSNALARRVASLRGIGTAGAYAVLAVAGAVVLVGIGMAAGLAWRRWRRRRRPEQGRPAPPGAPGEAVCRSAEAWLREAEARLAAEDLRGALGALWWWFAVALAGGEADPAWTTAEMLRRARRPDLRRHGLLLDRLRFGPAGATAEQVRGLVAEVSEGLR